MGLLQHARNLFGKEQSAWAKARVRPQGRLRLESLEARLAPATYSVGAGASIQSAINAAHPGDTIQISGVHAEQITVNKTLTLTGTSGAEIEAPSSLASGTSIVDITGQNVYFQGLTVSGLGNAGGKIEAAISIESSGSATIKSNTITGLYNGSASQTGYGIRDLGLAKIYGNTITDYQKDGIIVDGSSAAAKVGGSSCGQGNTVTGVGPNGNVAQNGIQVSDGAQALVSYNTISGNSYEGVYNGVGIYVYNDTNLVTVGQNSITGSGSGGGNDVGILVDTSSNTVVTNNYVTGTNAFGIYSNASSNITVDYNYVNANGGDGGVLYNTTNSIAAYNQWSNNKGDGLDIQGGSGNTVIFDGMYTNGNDGLHLANTSNNNIYFNITDGNQLDGIEVSGSSSTGNTIAFNVAAFNGNAGIVFDGGASQSANTYAFNVTYSNGSGGSVGNGGTSCWWVSNCNDSQYGYCGLAD
jgi:parallel beta-helix repeat protein